MNLATTSLRFLLGLSLCAAAASASSATTEVKSNLEGMRLAETLRHSWPEEDTSFSGSLVIQPDEGPTRRVPFRLSVQLGLSSWTATYRTQPLGEQAGEQLTIRHTLDSTNVYQWQSFDAAGQSHQDSGDVAPSSPHKSIFSPLGGSDFWGVDLGLDFFHWPGQRMIEQKKMRKGRWCWVLESSRPHAAPGEYLRVISWVDKEFGQPILAEAYDANNELLKEFSVGSFKKIEGQWHLEDMEMDNVQTDSRTNLEFDLKKK